MHGASDLMGLSPTMMLLAAAASESTAAAGAASESKKAAKPYDPDEYILNPVNKNKLEEVMELFRRDPTLVHFRERGSGGTLLGAASEAGAYDVAAFLIQSNVDVDATDIYGQSPLLKSAQTGHLKVFNLLLEHGAQLHTESNDSWNLLITAAGHEGSEKDAAAVIVKFLLDRNIQDVNQTTDRSNYTALYLSCLANSPSVTRLLLEAGADPRIATNFDPKMRIPSRRPSDIAAVKGHWECYKVVTDYERCYALSKARAVHDVNRERLLSPYARLPSFLHDRGILGQTLPTVKVVDLSVPGKVHSKRRAADCMRSDAVNDAASQSSEEVRATLEFVVGQLSQDVFHHLLRGIRQSA